MTAYLEEPSGEQGLLAFERSSLSGANGHSERWLQERLFRHPKLLPMVEMFGHGEAFVPLCRELPLRYSASNVFLDLLGVSPTGRLVLVECKLWRNPEARREVVAQLFEYASLLSGWTYSDLEARLKQTRGLVGENPIFKAVSAVFPHLGEAAFVDAVNDSLSRGDFLLAIAGDGIRSDLHALRRLMANQGGLLSRLAFLEIKIFKDESGRTLLVPTVPFQTEVIKREVLVRPDGRPLESATSVMPPEPTESEGRERGSPPNAARQQNREFWSKFIALVKFDHPDQPPPRHGGNNYVRIELPGPVAGLVAYRMVTGQAGFMMKFFGTDGREAMASLLEDQAALVQEVGQPVRFELDNDITSNEPVAGTMLVEYSREQRCENREESELEWFAETANSLVNALRPRLKQVA